MNKLFQNYEIVVPKNIKPGDKFQAKINGKPYDLTCPENLGPERKVKIEIKKKPSFFSMFFKQKTEGDKARKERSRLINVLNSLIKLDPKNTLRFPKEKIVENKSLIETPVKQLDNNDKNEINNILRQTGFNTNAEDIKKKLGDKGFNISDLDISSYLQKINFLNSDEKETIETLKKTYGNDTTKIAQELNKINKEKGITAPERSAENIQNYENERNNISDEEDEDIKQLQEKYGNDNEKIVEELNKINKEKKRFVSDRNIENLNTHNQKKSFQSTLEKKSSEIDGDSGKDGEVAEGKDGEQESANNNIPEEEKSKEILTKEIDEDVDFDENVSEEDQVTLKNLMIQINAILRHPDIGLHMDDEEFEGEGNQDVVEIHEEVEDDLGNVTRDSSTEVLYVGPYISKVETDI